MDSFELHSEQIPLIFFLLRYSQLIGQKSHSTSEKIQLWFLSMDYIQRYVHNESP